MTGEILLLHLFATECVVSDNAFIVSEFYIFAFLILTSILSSVSFLKIFMHFLIPPFPVAGVLGPIGFCTTLSFYQ